MERVAAIYDHLANLAKEAWCGFEGSSTGTRLIKAEIVPWRLRAAA